MFQRNLLFKASIALGFGYLAVCVHVCLSVYISARLSTCWRVVLRGARHSRSVGTMATVRHGSMAVPARHKNHVMSLLDPCR